MELKTKRIVVTGGTGFLGTHLVDMLRKKGCQQIAVPGRHQFDLTRHEAVDRLFEEFHPEILIHAAASVGGIGANLANPGRFFFENAMMGIQVIEACRRYEVAKTVVLGTICSYPKFVSVPFRESSLWDGYPEETNAPYGIAKKALLVQCQAYRAQFGMNAIFLLPVNLYGPGDNFDLDTSHVIPALVRKCVEAIRNNSQAITLWGDGSPTREFLFVDDAAEAIVMATEEYDGAEPINIGSGKEIAIRELAERIAVITGFKGRIEWDSTKPNGQPRRCLDVSRARQEFGFTARTDLDAGLRATVAWYTEKMAQSSA